MNLNNDLTKERRKHLRLPYPFSTQISKPGLDFPIEGMTKNVSQGGAFVKTEDHHLIRAQDRIKVTFLLPPDFTGQGKTIGLQGSGVVTRVDQKNEGVGIQLLKQFRHLELVEVTGIVEKITHEKFAYYLSTATGLSMTEFCSTYPQGFLVERREQLFDKNVIVQFTTEVADDEHVLEQLRRGAAHTDALNARVLEIRKRNTLADKSRVTIGRSQESDIVIHNRMVSREHAYLYLSPPTGTCFLVDTGAKNGTFLNDKRIEPHQQYELTDGDEICFGPETKVVYFSPRAFHNLIHMPIWQKGKPAIS